MFTVGYGAACYFKEMQGTDNTSQLHIRVGRNASVRSKCVLDIAERLKFLSVQNTMSEFNRLDVIDSTSSRGISHTFQFFVTQ